jgi:hypothetical protein
MNFEDKELRVVSNALLTEYYSSKLKNPQKYLNNMVTIVSAIVNLETPNIGISNDNNAIKLTNTLSLHVPHNSGGANT